MHRSRNVHHRRSAISAAAIALALLATSAAGCGADDDDAPSTGGRSTSTTEPTTTAEPTTTTEPTTTAEPTTTTEPAADRWIGTVWEAAPGGGGPLVDGEPVGLTSVAGLCRDSTCEVSTDLLTEAPTGGAPAPGPYLLWANRAVDRTDDGRAVWEVTDALEVELLAGSTTYVCAPTADPMVQVLGLGPEAPPAGDAITPDAVWTVDEGGALVSPDPAGFTCEVGMD